MQLFHRLVSLARKTVRLNGHLVIRLLPEFPVVLHLFRLAPHGILATSISVYFR